MTVCDANGVTYGLCRLRDGQVVLKVHISQIKALHGCYEPAEPMLGVNSGPQGWPTRVAEVSRPTPRGVESGGVDWWSLIFIPSCAPVDLGTDRGSVPPVLESTSGEFSSIQQGVGTGTLQPDSLDRTDGPLLELSAGTMQGERVSLVDSLDAAQHPGAVPEYEVQLGPIQTSTPVVPAPKGVRRSTRIKVTRYFGFNSDE